MEIIQKNLHLCKFYPFISMHGTKMPVISLTPYHDTAPEFELMNNLKRPTL